MQSSTFGKDHYVETELDVISCGELMPELWSQEIIADYKRSLVLGMAGAIANSTMLRSPRREVRL